MLLCEGPIVIQNAARALITKKNKLNKFIMPKGWGYSYHRAWVVFCTVLMLTGWQEWSSHQHCPESQRLSSEFFCQSPLFKHQSILAFADNPTSVVPASTIPDPGYIVAESSSGLGNRLRVLAAYMYIAKFKYNDAHLIFIWDTNEPCPGQFLSLFEPIPTVIFATNNSRWVVDKHAHINYENSYAVFTWIMKMNNIPRNRHGLPSWGQIEYDMHSRYYPVREIMFTVLEYVRKYNICESSAMHIRETDMALSLLRQSNGRKRHSLQPYIHFVESRPVNESIFLLTDNPATQHYFLQAYGHPKILVFSDMNTDLVNKLPMSVRNEQDIKHLYEDPVDREKRKKQEATLTGNQTILAEDHRFTTLQNTLIDVLIAAHAKHFKPAGFSSLSELVTMFSRIGKQDRGWCQG